MLIERDNLVKILSSDIFPGIGQETAKKVINGLDGKLVEVLDNGKPESLLHLITLKKAYILLSGWQLHKERMEVANWLDEHGIDANLGSTVWSVWGKQAIDKLKSNPYRLLAFCSWKKVDLLGKQLDIPIDSPVRLVGAAEQAAYNQLEQGDTLCTHESLTLQLMRLLPQGRLVPESMQQLANQSIQLALDTASLIAFADGYQIPGAYYAEQDIEKWLLRRQAQKCNVSDLDIKKFLAEFRGNTGITLTEEQKITVNNAIQAPVSVFYGGAGVGKTFTLKAVCDAVEMILGKPPVLLALAAKAARRVSELTQREAMTIAKCQYHVKSSELANSLIVIDEASMVDLLGFRNLIRKIPDSSHLVLVGDPAQLPSIGAGNVLHDFLRYSNVPIQELTKVHRQAAKTGIPDILGKIRKGIWPELTKFSWDNPEQTGIEFLSVPEYRIYQECEKLIRIYERNAQIISPLVQGKLGTEAINEKIHTTEMGTDEWLPGTPVVFNSNERLKSGEYVDNGLTGQVHSWLTKSPRSEYTPWLLVETEYGNKTVTLGEAEKFIQLGWALSVHKVQGSSWETIIAVLPPHNKLLTRDMIYTALSRCEKRCICIIPDQKAVTRAVAMPPVCEIRRTGLFR